MLRDGAVPLLRANFLVAKRFGIITVSCSVYNLIARFDVCYLPVFCDEDEFLQGTTCKRIPLPEEPPEPYDYTGVSMTVINVLLLLLIIVAVFALYTKVKESRRIKLDAQRVRKLDDRQFKSVQAQCSLENYF